MPYHRLAPRTADQARELAQFTANLGTHLATCVYQDGCAEHLFNTASRQYAVAVEWLTGPASDGKYYCMEEVLSERGETLAEYAQRRPKVAFKRERGFDVRPRAEIAEWVEEREVAWQLTADARAELFGDRNRHVVSCEVGGVWKEIHGRRGEYYDGSDRISREQVADIIERHLRPKVNKLIPEGFDLTFSLSRSRLNLPVAAADVIGLPARSEASAD